MRFITSVFRIVRKLRFVGSSNDIVDIGKYQFVGVDFPSFSTVMSCVNWQL